MRVIAWLRHKWLEAVWVGFAGLNVVAMVVWPTWETIPFHFIWVSLTLLFGFRLWRARNTYAVLLLVISLAVLLAIGAARRWATRHDG